MTSWNTLPSSVQDLSDTESFKCHLKTVLLSAMLLVQYFVLISFLSNVFVVSVFNIVTRWSRY